MNRNSNCEQKKSQTRKFGSRGVGLCLALAMGMLSWKLAFASTEVMGCDVIAQASVKILGIKTTTTSATITWKEAHSNDSRYFCYGSTLQSSCNIKVVNRSSHITTVTGLTPNTKYYYIFYGVGHGKKTTTTGSFITDGSECITPNSTKVQVSGFVLDATLDSLENVVVGFSKTSGGSVINTDTTDRSGGYMVYMDPGTYFVSFTYPPFTSPNPLQTPQVVTGRPLTLTTQKLTGAFQVGGTVVGVAKDSIEGAIVTAVSTLDPTLSYTRVTDGDGHFNFGLKAGSYTINARSSTYKLATPVTLSVSDKDVHMTNLSLSVPVSIRQGIKKSGLSTRNQSGDAGYQINGASLQPKSKSATRIKVYRTSK